MNEFFSTLFPSIISYRTIVYNFETLYYNYIGETMNEDNIYIYQNKPNHYLLVYPKYHIKTKAYIGKNGLTNNKKEGDLKTPKGTFDIGIKLSLKPFKKCQLITNSLYWIDDINSKYYNKLVDINNVTQDYIFTLQK